MQPDDAIPVTLLTGFLGSGKTTVLNHLLTHRAFGRAAVIVNEFGEIGLDHELVVSSDDDIILLESGCLCCALRGDLAETLLDLHERLLAGELDFDRVVIETTGLADPAPILHTLLTDYYLTDHFRTDGVVSVVDAATGPQTLAAHEDARRQVAMADLVLLTKTDLPEALAAEVRAQVETLNSGVRVIEVLNGQIDPELLLNLGHFDLTMKSEDVATWMRAEAIDDRAGHADRQGGSIRSVSWIVEQPLMADQFDFWMEILMARRGADLLRLKALVHLVDVPFPFVVHGVQHIFHPPVPLKDWSGEDRRTRFVLILRDFSDHEVQDLFDALGQLSAFDHLLPGGAFLTAEAPA